MQVIKPQNFYYCLPMLPAPFYWLSCMMIKEEKWLETTFEDTTAETESLRLWFRGWRPPVCDSFYLI